MLAQPRLNSTLLVAFAVVALVLSGIGVYSVMSFSVAQRRHEIGIRLALGARKSAVLRLLLGEGAWIAALALLAGGAVSLITMPFVRKVAHAESMNHLITLGCVALLLGLIALLASWWPRATCGW